LVYAGDRDLITLTIINMPASAGFHHKTDALTSTTENAYVGVHKCIVTQFSDYGYIRKFFYCG
jgi:hypothetical protein